MPALLLASALACLAQTAAQADDCSEHLSQATRLFGQGKDQEALRYMRAHQEQCRNSVQFNLLLSTILIRMNGHAKEAADAAATALSLDPKSLAANMQYAVCLNAAGDREKAVAAFRQLVKIDPSNYDAWSALNALYSDLGDQEEAKKCANKAACLEPNSRTARVRTARNLYKAGKFQALSTELKRLISDDDLEPEFFIPLAKDALSMNAYDEAIQAADRALAVYPHSPDCIKAKAEAQLWQRHYEDGLNTLAKLQAAPSGRSRKKNERKQETLDPQTLAIKALLHLRLGQSREAEEAVAKLPERNDKLPIACLAKAISLQYSGDSQAAQKQLFASLQDDQLFAPAHVELARLFLRQGKDEEALGEAREAMRVRVFKASGKAMEARLALEQAPLREKMEEAMRLAKEAVKENADDPEANIALALCELRAGHLDPARSAISHALEIEPGNIDAMLAQSKLFESEGNNAKRMETIKSAQQVAKGDSEVLVALAQAHIDSGDSETAVEILKQSPAMEHGDALVVFALARAYERSGQAKEAATYFKQSLAHGLKGPRAAIAREALKQFGGSM